MPNEPQRPVEQLLATYAQQRREQVGAPFELHPAMRKLLRDEVARTFPRRSEAPASRFDWLKTLWPRVALAGSLTVAAGLAVVLFLQFQPHSQRKLALAKQATLPSVGVDGRRNEARPEAKYGRVLERQPAQITGAPMAPALPAGAHASSAAGPAPVERDARRSQAEPAATRSADVSEQAKADAESLGKRSTTYLAYAEQAKEPAATQTSSAEDKGDLLTSQVQPAPPARMVRRYGLPTPPSSGRAGGLGGSGRIGGAVNLVAQAGQLNQRFTQAARYRRNFNSPALDVLNSFQLEQNGPRILILDADGSVYEGTIEQPASLSSQRADTLQTAAPVAAEDKQLPVGNQQPAVAGAQAAGAPVLESFAFTVSGTNRTLNQAVVFFGNYNADTNSIRFGMSNNQAQIRQSTASAMPTQNQLHLPNAVVQGRAVIGGSNRLEINAVPAGP